MGDSLRGGVRWPAGRHCIHMEAVRLRRLARATVHGREVAVADRRVSRLLGLAFLSRDRAGPGLLIPACRSVHTFGMRFRLDIVFFDRDGQTLRELAAVRPHRVVACTGAAAVLELPSGACARSAARVESGKPLKGERNESDRQTDRSRQEGRRRPHR